MGAIPSPGAATCLGVRAVNAVASVGRTDYVALVQSLPLSALSDLGFGTANAQPLILSFPSAGEATWSVWRILSQCRQRSIVSLRLHGGRG